MPEKSSPKLTVFFIKLCLLAGLVVVLWPLPRALTFTSPNPAVLGRYTLKYFVLLSALVGFVAIWLAATGWGGWRLNAASLDRLRAWIAGHVALALAAVALLASGLLAARAGLLADLLSVPGILTETMQIMPGLAFGLLAALILLIVNGGVLTAVEDWLAQLADRIRISWQTVGLVVGFALLLAVLLGIALDGRYWDYPSTIDSGLHVFIGQHVLRGGVPYQTFLYHYPPFRFWLSMLWSLGANALHLPVLHFVRGLDLLVAAGLLVTLYAIGQGMTGRRSLGLAAALLYLGTEHVQDLLIFGPTFRQTTILLSLLGILLAQRRRWFWAGVLSACGAMLYNPSIGFTGAILFVALLQDKDERWRAVLGVAGGLALVVGGSALVLLIQGVLPDAYRQAVLSLFLELRAKATQPDQADSVSFIDRWPWYVDTFRWILRGDWEIVLLAGGGIGALVVKERWTAIRSPKTGPLLLSAGLMAFYLILSFDGSYRDSALLVVAVMPFGVFPAALLLDRLAVRPVPTGRVQAGAAAAVFAAIALLALPDTVPYQEYQYSLATITLSEQIAQTDAVEAVLKPDDEVLVFGNLWYLMFANRDNPVPFREAVAQYIPQSIEVTGWTYERMVDTLRAARPVLVLEWGTHSPLYEDWLAENYDFLGIYDPDGRGFAQRVFVRADRPDVRAVLETWPLSDPAP